MKYFFDNCISYRYAAMLHALGECEVVALRDKFPEGIEDLEFIPQLKDQGYVYVTADDRQKTRRQEAKAIQEAGLTALWFGPFWSKMDLWGQAKWIITRWEKIDGYVRGVAPGTCSEVKQNGKSQPFQF